MDALQLKEDGRYYRFAGSEWDKQYRVLFLAAKLDWKAGTASIAAVPAYNVESRSLPYEGESTPASPAPSLRIEDVQWRYTPDKPDSEYAGPMLPIQISVSLLNVVVQVGMEPRATLDILRAGLVATAFKSDGSLERLTAEAERLGITMTDDRPSPFNKGARMLSCSIIAKLHYSTQGLLLAMTDAAGRTFRAESVWGNLKPEWREKPR
jgi:hypothetical protein